MAADITFEYSSLTKKWSYEDIEVEIIPEGYGVKIQYAEDENIYCKIESQYGLIYFLTRLLGTQPLFKTNAEVDADYLV
tara:strand:+ start:250 stop:486 length:237 start_codon:yes stop_codon:yes gene_type:complete